jgi:hypothetical protein
MHNLMKFLIETAGAQRGYLILKLAQIRAD